VAELDDSVTEAEEFDLDWLGETTSPKDMGDPKMIGLYGPPGHGKGHPYGTPVLTTSGWVPVEELTEGDQVIGSDGAVYFVYGTYDRGVLPVFEVTMSDGASVRVDADHLWSVVNKKGNKQIISTRDILESWDAIYSRYNLKIPPAPACQLDESVYLPLPPYAMGALLADGSLHGASIQWTKNSQEVADEMARSLETVGYSLREITCKTSTARQWKIDHIDNSAHWSVIKRALEDLSLDVPSGDKFIPYQYFASSIAQRWELLNGLFDGDGSLTGRGVAKYTTTSPRLADDVLQLCWSLGIAAHLLRNGSEKTWAVVVQSDHNPFLASELRVKAKPHVSDHIDRRIVSVVPAGQDEVRCIAVTAPDQLYVTKDYIVTHNTWFGASACMVEGYYPLLLIDTEGSATGTVAKFPDDRIVIKEVKTVAEFDSLIVNLINKKHPFKTVMVDTLGNHLDRKEWEIMRNPPKTIGGAEDTQKAWGMLYNYAKKLIDGLRSADFKTIIVFHEKEEKDKLGATMSRIWINGAAKKYIPSKPDMFGLIYCETDDDTGKEVRTLYLGADTERATKTRFSDIGLPTKIVDPSMAKVVGIIRDKLNENKED